MKHWNRFFLRYFDWNDDGVTNWWEYFIPIIIILLVEVIAELIANWVV